MITLEEKILAKLDTGTNTLKVFAASNDVLRPYEYFTSFLVSDKSIILPDVEITTTLSESEQNDYSFLFVIIILVIAAAIIFVIKAKTQRVQKSLNSN